MYGDQDRGHSIKWLTLIAYIHRIRLLIIKANLWAHVGKPTKGFSIALRAANAGYMRCLLPYVCQGVAALAAILIELEEYEAARRLLDSVIPKVHDQS